MAGGIATLNLAEDFITHDSLIVKGGFYPNLERGGITTRVGLSGKFSVVGHLAHEFGHYLFGGGHTNFGGLMVGDPYTYASGTYMMNGWERAWLGYITPTVPSTNGQEIILGDFVTTGNCVKIPIPFNNPSSSTFFVVENHQRVSKYDQIMRGEELNGGWNFTTTLGSGIYVWVIRNGNTWYPFIDIKAADGSWNWVYDGDYYAGPGWYVGKPYEGYLPKTRRISVNRNADNRSDRYPEHIYWNNHYASKWVDINTLTNDYYISRDVMGDKTDPYNIDYNELLTLWSNPSSYVDGSTNISIKLANKIGNNITLAIYSSSDSALMLPPSKPQNLKATINTQHNTVLTWEGNIEPDVLSGGRYKIYKAKTSGNPPSTYNLVDEPSGPVTTWTDPEITIGDSTYKVFYKISAVDITNKESVLSEYSWVNYISSNITASTTFSGNLTVEKTMNVASNVTLTIQEGSFVRFSERATLIVNGTLTANGAQSNKITFDFIEPDRDANNGIKVNFGGTINISNSIIKNAYRGINIVLGGGESLIQNSLIQYCYDGIVISYGNKDAQLTVEQCEIKNNYNYGIRVTNKTGYGMNSEPFIANNHIESCNYGIYLIGNVGLEILRNEINNCTQGIYVYEGQPSIMRNTILNPLQNGIYCTASGRRPLILDNVIQKESHIYSYHNYQGIWIENNTAAYIAHNDISGFYWGIYCGGGVNSYFSDYEFHDFYPNNRIRDNLFGFAAGWGSYIYAGREVGDGCWNNSIYGNRTYDVVSYQHSFVMAQYNYWGGGRPNALVDGTSELYADEILERDPWGENKFLANSSNNPLPTEGSRMDIVKGIFLEKSGQIDEAIKHYKQMISKNSYAGFALTELAKFRNKYSITNLQSYFNTLITSNSIHKEKVLRILAAIHLSENRYDEAMQVYNSIINQFPNSRSAMYARFEKYYAALNHAEDLTTAFQLLQEIRGLGLTDDEFLMKLELAEELYDSAANTNSFSKSSSIRPQVKQTQQVPSEYKLFGNYPNPFNPATTISYALPFESEVTVTVFDLTGRIIRTFNLSNQSAGYKDLVWDGRNGYGEQVSSGVYLYMFKAISLEGNGKTFVKCAKCMLLK